MLAAFRRHVPSRMIQVWIVVTLVASIIAAVDGGWLARKAAFAPERIWAGEIWRVITWIFVDRSPFSLAMTCLVIYRFGSALAARWGDLGLRRYLLDVVLASSGAAAFLAWASDDAWLMHRCGSWAVCDALVIGWARQFPRDAVLLYGVAPFRGKSLVAVTAGLTVLVAIFVGPFVFAPELIACAVAIYYPPARLREITS